MSLEMVAAMADRCDALRAPGIKNLVVSIFILVGMLVSYLPQHVRIIARGTAEGISPFFILLGVTSATSGLANILTLPQSRQDVACCHELDTLHCMAGLLGIAQLGVQWMCFVFILVLFLVFFRYNDNVPAEEQAEQPPWQTAVLVATICAIHGLLVIVVTAVLVAVAPKRLSLWANVLGIMAAALAAVQYVPQIATTYRLKHVGSLSIPMMCMQTPGGLLFAGSLFARLGWDGWSSWGIFLLTATMQGVLLGMGIYYEVTRDAGGHSHESSDASSGGHSNGHNTGHNTGHGTGHGTGHNHSHSHGHSHSHSHSHGSGHGSSAPPQVQVRKSRPLYQRMLSYRSARFDDGTPSRYSAHPEHYGSTPDEISDIIDRQESDAAAETQPLLRPGGIGNPRRDYDAAR